ncbi:MAG: IgGFc-binding protein, partial [Bacteroidota bacterium]|nr:IgGFc-binding protein [Bacteroidota bacterium]
MLLKNVIRLIGREIIFSLALALICAAANSQDFSNKGKDFWLAYPGHIDATSSRMALYISSDQNTAGVVELAGATISFNVSANQATVVQIYPTTYNVYNSQSDGINAGKGIHITSAKPIVVYAHVLNSARSGSTLVLPTNTLGRDYTCIAYTQVSNGPKTAKSQFTVVGVEDNTTVEITPTVPSVNNTRAAGVAFTVVLNKGDVYQFQSYSDITGSKVKSLSTGSGCKPLAVFSGSTWDYFDCPAGTSGDNLFGQLFPSATWGKNYVTAPFVNRQSDIFRIMVQDPTSIITLNGTQLNAASLINGTYYEFKSSTGNVITSDKPIIVIQFMTSMACTPNATVGDPEMIILNAVEQTLKSATVLSARRDLTPPNTNITAHYLNIITLSSAAASIRVDGVAPASQAQAIAGSKYVFFQENVTNSTLSNPTHTISGDSGFIAIAYGVGNVESYGYNAGTNVKDLYQYVSLKNEYSTVDFPATCRNTPFQFSITLPYNATSLTWDFNNNANLFPNNIVVNNSPKPDSTFTRDGRSLY